ncbi:MAG TPA: phosphatase PAP2 family protein [Gammaproteobacteria bacterium]|nr:phosphatase PAP2 family protein [Gammaproteobacteria bacterium]
MARRFALAFERFDQAELRFCRYLNRSSGSAAVRQAFRAVSWLGDGWIWYGLLLSLPLIYGHDGLVAALHMALTGAVGVLVYKAIKTRAVRERPYITHSAIQCASVPLDRYSFPSGHTLHAISFTLLTAGYFPEWTAVLASLALLIALSRVILGLHYPTDVAAGALLGGVLGMSSLELGQRFLA